MSKKGKRERGEEILTRGVTYGPLRELALWLNLYISHLPQKHSKSLADYKRKQKNYLRRVSDTPCMYCKRSHDLTHEKHRTRDHIIPSSRGGLNVPENRGYACKECNEWKSYNTPGEWRRIVHLQLISGKKRGSYSTWDLSNILRSLKKVMLYVKQNKHILQNKISSVQNK